MTRIGSFGPFEPAEVVGDPPEMPHNKTERFLRSVLFQWISKSKQKERILLTLSGIQLEKMALILKIITGFVRQRIHGADAILERSQEDLLSFSARPALT